MVTIVGIVFDEDEPAVAVDDAIRFATTTASRMAPTALLGRAFVGKNDE